MQQCLIEHFTCAPMSESNSYLHPELSSCQSSPSKKRQQTAIQLFPRLKLLIFYGSRCDFDAIINQQAAPRQIENKKNNASDEAEMRRIIVSIPAERRATSADAERAVRPSVRPSSRPSARRSISRRGRASGFRKQSVQVSWVISESRRTPRKTQSHDPVHYPAWLSAPLGLHSPACLLARASRSQLLTHPFTQQAGEHPTEPPQSGTSFPSVCVCVCCLSLLLCPACLSL